MFKRSIIGFIALLVAGVVFAQAYKWTDEDGVVHYSDRPHPGAEIVQLPEQHSSPRAIRPAPTVQRPTRYGASKDQAETPAQPFSYQTLEITTPAAEQTLWNIEGVLNVTLNLQPALQPGHSVRAYFDGTPQQVSGTSFQIQEVYRGVHNLQVEVIDETGKLMIRSLPNRFYVQQNSIARAH